LGRRASRHGVYMTIVDEEVTLIDVGLRMWKLFTGT